MTLDINQILLLLSILTPFVASLMCLFGQKMGEQSTRGVALVGFVLPAVLALVLAAQFPGAEKFEGFAYHMAFAMGLEQMGIQLALGLNGIGLPLYVLAGIVGAAAGIYALRQDVERKHLYLTLLLFMQTGLMGIFVSVDLFFYYFFHEFALIPTFILIGIWGGEGRRRAAMEMTVYLTLGALLTLAGLIALYLQTGANSFNLIQLRQAVAYQPLEGNLFGLLLIGFGILVSLFPFHSWAPRGYAAAPAPAAMLHAGVLKKFGLYGLIQVAVPLLPQEAMQWQEWIVWLALGNVVLIGLVTMAQRDLKQMIGYSSVMHMGYAFLGIATLGMAGVGGAVMLMFAHGLSVALLFLLANMVEERAGSLDMSEMGGLGPKTPILAAFFVAATMASIGLPGFANFWGELTVFVALWEQHSWAVAPAVLGVVISAIYGLRAVARVFYGKPTQAQELRWNMETNTVKDMSLAERAPAFLLVIALAVVGIYPRTISTQLDEALATMPAYGGEAPGLPGLPGLEMGPGPVIFELPENAAVEPAKERNGEAS